MKKKMIIGVLSAGLILGGALAVGATNNDQKETTAQKTSETTKQMISAEKAKEIALSKAEGFVEEIELERGNGKTYYEVEIENSKDDFHIYIDAYTGEVLAVEEDHDDNDDWGKENHASNQNLISEQEAVKIAEQAANGTVVEVELDEDDNRYIYELELKTKNGEAEVDIDAATGKVLELEYDDEN